MESPLLIDDINKSFDQVEVLKSLRFELKTGEIFGLLGPNGAGKTTLISILTSLLAPSSGTAAIFGNDILTQSLQARKKVGVVPQEIVSHGFFTVNQVLNFHSGYYGLRKNQERIDYLLEKLALAEHQNKLVAQLSGGMKRRLLIAKALVHSPPLLLLDEPTAGVDVELRHSLWRFVRELHKDGMTILLTTHYLDEAEELCDRIGVLSKGELIALDETKKLIHDLTHRQVILTLTQPLESKPALPEMQVNKNIVKVNIAHQETVGELIKKLAIPLEWIQDVSITEGSLEDAFVSLLKQHTR
ncbi:MAG: ABC transporter ATP-binding protein [SAR324 cluster bacterium]|nr:ABC transporter ATP-binding protein [SAR324 cluster bacterium]